MLYTLSTAVSNNIYSFFETKKKFLFVQNCIVIFYSTLKIALLLRLKKKKKIGLATKEQNIDIHQINLATYINKKITLNVIIGPFYFIILVKFNNFINYCIILHVSVAQLL